MEEEPGYITEDRCYMAEEDGNMAEECGNMAEWPLRSACHSAQTKMLLLQSNVKVSLGNSNPTIIEF